MAQTIALLDPLAELLGGDRFRVRHFGLYVCEPAWSWSPPVFTDFDFWIVLEGRGEFRINGEMTELRPGVGFLIQPGDQVSALHDPDKPLEVFASHLERTNASGAMGERMREHVLRFEVNDPSYFRAMAVEALQLGLADKPSALLAQFTIAQMIMRAFIGHGIPLPSGAPSPLERIAMEIRSRPGHDWTTEAMARRCSLSIPQFNRQFRQCMGKSPRQFVIHQRVSRAEHLLRESDMTIQQIAQALGYNDHFFFHRQFRKITGKTPGDIRKEARGS